MGTEHPIFNDVEKRAIAATVVTENGQPLLILDDISEGKEPTRVLVLNKFDAKQLSAACDRYLHQAHSVDYANVNTLLTERDRVELLGEDDD